MGWIPFVDFETCPTLYNDGLINNTNNSWEYYFQRVSDISRLPINQNETIISSSSFPPGYDYTLQNNPGLYNRVVSKIKLQPHIKAEVEIYRKQFDANVLGVQFRGQEIRYFRGHFLPPTKKQMAKLIQTLIEEKGFTSVFVSSEDQGLIDFVAQASPVPTFCTKSFRLRNKNSYSIYPRAKHFYNLGKEVLVDAILLSLCNGLIHCSSNVANFSRFMCQDDFILRAEILNWQNTKIAPFNYFTWPVFRFVNEVIGDGSYDRYVSVYNLEKSPRL